MRQRSGMTGESRAELPRAPRANTGIRSNVASLMKKESGSRQAKSLLAASSPLPGPNHRDQKRLGCKRADCSEYPIDQPELLGACGKTRTDYSVPNANY